jgi:hypothetical protein
MMANPKPQTPTPKVPNDDSPIGRWASAIGIFVAAFALRLLPLGHYVTPDEPAWVYRAIHFADALAARDWTAVPATGHPGVTTMWLGAAGVTVQRLLDPSGSAAHLDWIRRLAWLAPENGEAFRHLAPFLPWGRVAVALVTTLGLIVLYPLLVRLFDQRVALLTVGLLACDPFLTGHSGLLHTDALLATFSLLALATALCGLREPRRAIWSALSGLLTGLALLTKTPALILPPFVLLLIAIAHLRKSQTSNLESHVHRLPVFIAHCSLFMLLAIITCLALYPALWTDPAGTLRTLSTFVARHAEMIQRPIFFAGQTTYDPGPAFYPVVLLFRVSPVVLVGLTIGLVILRRLPSDRRLAFLLSIGFAVGFGALMSLGAKKHDRYLLPAFPPLTLAAALGIRTLIDRQPGKSTNPTDHQSTNYQPTNLPIYQCAILAFQALIALAFVFHPLTYANPLAGGPWAITRVLPVDWGEGMGAAARWLNQRPDAERLTVAAASVPSVAPLFEGRTVPLDRASLADYFVVGPNQPTSPLTERPASQPARTVTLGPLNHAFVLTNTAPFEQAAHLAAHAGPDDLIVLDADTPLLRHYSGPGTLISTADLPDQAAVVARLAGLSVDHVNLWLVADPAASAITAAHLRQRLETIATPVYTAEVASATISRYVVRDDGTRNDVVRDTRYTDFSSQLTLIAAVLPSTPVNAPFRVFLRWQVPTPASTDLHASLTLRDPTGHLWAEVGQLVLNGVYFPTSVWPPGEWADNATTLKLPAHIPPSTYGVQLIVTDGEGAQLGAWDANGQFQGVRVPLGEVEIAPPAEPGGPAPCTAGHTLTGGPLLACAPDLPPQTIPSGDVFTLALTWSSTAPPETDYRVRWRLLDSASSVALEQTADLCPYTTSHWRAGDSFEARYDLRPDPALPVGRYTLALNVLASDGRPLWSQDETLTSIEILPRDRLFELPPDIAHPLDLTLGTTVHLRGFDLSPHSDEEGTGAGALQPGDTLSLILYWQADGPTDIDYTTFIHLVGPDGRPHGQVDQFASGAPTTSWAPGQVIVDEIALPVAADAPDGTYHIAVGMYDATSGGRLPVTDASGHPLPDDQAILPVEVTVVGGSQ